jgi:hypothetical protein
LIEKLKAQALGLDVLQTAAVVSPVHAASAEARSRASLADYRIAHPDIFLPHRCDDICDGIVEVYKRVCCCPPIVIDDLRIPEIEIPIPIPDPPVIAWPPRPDPPPFSDLPFFKDFTLDERALNAKRDSVALQTLSGQAKSEYVIARPYLHLCHCGPAAKVATGTIDPGGHFHICWREGPVFLHRHCHVEYAFIVRQIINGVDTIIYNGLAANQWFHADDEIELVSYHPRAIGCRHNDFPEQGAFALLQDIGLTESHNLKTPGATGAYSVAAPAYNDGLAFPAANPAAALGQYKDRNWGGTLNLRYAFSEALKTTGAVFYRVSVIASDAFGNPSGTRDYLEAPVSWKYFEITSGGLEIHEDLLGPVSAGGHNNLFRIPYDADRDWQSGQYHALLDTATHPEGRYLLTLEVFNAAGVMMRPQPSRSEDGSSRQVRRQTYRSPRSPTCSGGTIAPQPRASWTSGRTE